MGEFYDIRDYIICTGDFISPGIFFPARHRLVLGTAPGARFTFPARHTAKYSAILYWFPLGSVTGASYFRY